MSRFFATGSETESETESSEEEVVPQKTPAIVSTFAHSDDEEDVKRVVRSAREKRYEELEEIIKKMRNHKKIKDMSNLLASFENLTRAFAKAKPVIEKEEGGVIPKFYIRCLVELENFISDCWEDREGRKNMSKNNSKSLATMRQKLRKYNKDFEAEIAAYRENPEEEEKEDEKGSDEEDNEDDTDFLKKEAKEEIKAKPKAVASDEGESDGESTDWGSESESESSISSDDEKYGGNLAAKFLKKAPEKDEEERKKQKRKREKREKKHDDEGEWEEVVKGVPLIMEKPKMFSKDAEITHAVVIRKLNEILAARGKKGTDRSEQIELLTELLSISNSHNLGPGLGLKIMFAIISAIYDYNANISTCMKPEMWQQCLNHLNTMLDVLIANPTITVGEHVAEESESLITPPYRVRGCILTVVERMDEEFCKILQACDAHSPEYVERLKDETIVCNIILRLEKYLEEKGTPSEICRIYLRHIDHIYYKCDRAALEKNNSSSKEKGGEPTSVETMARLAKYIYAKDTTDRIRTQAILFHIFHQALHDNLDDARNLMFMSHLQESIQYADVPTQILFNRAVVQIGLCYFRHGEIKEAHAALLDIQSGGRAKELLAQGLLPQRQHERTSEQEKIEKRRQIPFHKHINLELLECVYLVSAMLLEIPYMAAHELDGRKRMISKSYHHQLRNSERQPLVGPPESMREHVVAASKAMRVGNWRACRNFIINDKMNAKVWDLFPQPARVQAMLTSKIQEASLRTYLFTYSHVYDSLSIPVLAQMFELPTNQVYSTVSKMIIGEDLMASLDEPTQTVVMHRTEPTRIQALALQLADKVNSLTEQNDKLSDLKAGNVYFGRNIGTQGGYRDSGYTKSNQQDRNWGRRRPY